MTTTIHFKIELDDSTITSLEKANEIIYSLNNQLQIPHAVEIENLKIFNDVYETAKYRKTLGQDYANHDNERWFEYITPKNTIVEIKYTGK